MLFPHCRNFIVLCRFCCAWVHQGYRRVYTDHRCECWGQLFFICAVMDWPVLSSDWKDTDISPHVWHRMMALWRYGSVQYDLVCHRLPAKSGHSWQNWTKRGPFGIWHRGLHMDKSPRNSRKKDNVWGPYLGSRLKLSGSDAVWVKSTWPLTWCHQEYCSFLWDSKKKNQKHKRWGEKWTS